MDSIMKRTALIGLLIGFLGLGVGLVSYAAEKEAAVGDTIPAIETSSMEGLPITLRPPEGVVQFILFWDADQAESAEAAKEAIVLFNRFKEKGLSAIGVCVSKSEDNTAAFCERWLVPFPVVMDAQNDPSIAGQLGVTGSPLALLVDSQGKVLAVNLKGEDAHAKVAEILNVSLDDLPMPPAPVAREKNENNPGMVTLGQDGGTLLQGSEIQVQEYFLGNPDERKAAEGCIANLRKINLALIRYRQDHNDELPDWLSDLYPKYIDDQSVFLDPKFPEATTDFPDYVDPKLTCSFLYEFNPTRKAWKGDQLKQYGDKVPVVRSLKYDRPINLSYGGEIYFSRELNWENDFQPNRTVNDLDAQIRRRLRRIAVALDDYKKERGEVPNELKDLIPKYVPSESDVSFPENKSSSLYEFSPNIPNAQEPALGATYREWKTNQMKEFGDYVPIVRVWGVLVNGRVINLSYGGEIWESDAVWESNLQGKSSLNTNRTVLRLSVQVPQGEEMARLAERRWPDEPLKGKTAIDLPVQMIPLKGLWLLLTGKIEQNLDVVDNTVLVFSPFVKNGEMSFKAKVIHGKEGVRVVFGFTAPDRYFVWNIGGWGNTATVIEKRTDLYSNDYQLLIDKKDYVFNHGEWHEVRLVLDSDAKTVKGFVDGQEIIALKTDENLEGRLGVGTWSTAVDFESIVIEGK